MLPALEKLFERAQRQDGAGLYHWLARVYSEYGKTPCHIFRKLMRNPEGNSELIARSKTLIDQAKKTFEQQLEDEPDDWYSLRGLGDIYETFGETELASKYPWDPHSDYRWAQPAWEGLQLPDFSASTLDGTQISFSDYHGKLVLLHFCAWWCGPCTGEIPYVKEVYEEHHKNGFEVIRISIDEEEKDLRNYIEEHEIPWVQVFENSGNENGPAKFFGINRLPFQWLIDRDGTIISVMNRQFLLGQNLNRAEPRGKGTQYQISPQPILMEILYPLQHSKGKLPCFIWDFRMEYWMFWRQSTKSIIKMVLRSLVSV